MKIKINLPVKPFRRNQLWGLHHEIVNQKDSPVGPVRVGVDISQLCFYITIDGNSYKVLTQDLINAIIPEIHKETKLCKTHTSSPGKRTRG